MLQFFGLLSGILPTLGAIPYIRDIFRHTTKPHRGSFFIWLVLGAIAFFSQAAKGASWSLFLPGADTLATCSIFILSIRYGTGGLSRQDVIGLVLAGLGLVIWYFTKQPLVALLIAIGVDAVGTVLTLIKTWREPHTETFSSWLLASLGGLFAAVAVGKLSLALLIYPIYMCIANGSVDIIMLLRRSKLLDGIQP